MSLNEILFIYLFGEERVSTAYSLGAAYIQAFLKSKGISSLQFKLTQPCSLDSFVDQVLSLRIPIIGFTCYENNYPFIVMLANALKRRKKDITIIVGGPSPSFADEIILKDCEAIDICVRGEGEYAAFDLLTKVKKGGSLRAIEGISFRHRGKTIKTPQRPLINSGVRGAELDIIPSPYLSGIIPVSELDWDSNSLGILTSRGCPYRCIYCNFSAMGRQQVRFHSVDRVIEELKYIYKAIKDSRAIHSEVMIYDDTFTVYPKRAEEICKRILESELAGLKLHALTRTDRINYELMDLLLKAGVKTLGIGLESAVPRILNCIRKVRLADNGRKDDYEVERAFLAKIKRAVQYGKQLGMKVRVSMMQGLPGESYKDVQQTVRFIKSLGIEDADQNKLYVFPGTELFMHANKYGIKLKKDYKGSLHFSIKSDSSGIRYPIVFPDGRMNKFLQQALPGVYRVFCDIPPTSLTFPLQEIILANRARLPRQFLHWLNKETNIMTAISFLGRAFSDNDIKRNFELISQHGFFSIPLHYLIKYGKNNYFRSVVSRIEPFSFRWQDNAKPPRFHFVPLHLYKSTHEIVQTNKGGSHYVIFRLETKKDIAALTTIADRIYMRKNLTIQKSLSRFVPALEDECRWSNRLCPASSIPKIIVNRKDRIYPCMNGKAIGKVGESFDDIRNRMKRIMEKEMLLRGCEKCHVRDQCSKCPFPYPVNRKDYCKIRKNNPAIHRVVLLMKIPRSILSLQGDKFTPQKFTLMRTGSVRIKKGCSKLSSHATYPQDFHALLEILEKMKAFRKDILFFAWGNNYYMGSRRRKYMYCVHEALKVYEIGVGLAQCLSDILWLNRVDEIFHYLYGENEMDKQSIKSLVGLLTSIHDKVSNI